MPQRGLRPVPLPAPARGNHLPPEGTPRPVAKGHRAGLHPALHRLPAGGSGGGRHSPVARRVTAAPPRPPEGDSALQKALRRAEERSVIGHKPTSAVHPWRMTAAPPCPPEGDSALQKSLRRAEERSVIGRG